ncbi:50S ribosomal protein L10 [Tuberibacillus sp. Marseille-P3662]|uniref:50S ribosomal protein L10 n=1 Tax=Tuberibacillus sp. Marseille-P3662 TaxID=1965358 RepID=UPI000A1CDCF9|nr:50S ribosomal protein L10 [Tuberibacillus sp. Marseille-P3662]
MSQAIESKKQVVEEITGKLNNSISTVIVDYRGLDVDEVTELRKQLREAGVDFKVYKNTMMRRAADNAGYAELNEHFVGPTAVAFSNEDVVAPAKILHNFSKEHQDLEIKTGVVEGAIADFDQIKALAEIPSQEGLLSMLLNVLQAPIRNFALASKAVADQKEESA